MNARQAEALAARAKLPETEKRTAEKDGDLEEISSFMTRNLGLKVKISAGRGGGGKVVLQYANPADLDKIIDILQQKSTLTSSTGRNLRQKPLTERESDDHIGKNARQL